MVLSSTFCAVRVGEGQAKESPTPNYADSSHPKGDGGLS